MAQKNGDNMGLKQFYIYSAESKNKTSESKNKS